MCSETWNLATGTKKRKKSCHKLQIHRHPGTFIYLSVLHYTQVHCQHMPVPEIPMRLLNVYFRPTESWHAIYLKACEEFR